MSHPYCHPHTGRRGRWPPCRPNRRCSPGCRAERRWSHPRRCRSCPRWHRHWARPRNPGRRNSERYRCYRQHTGRRGRWPPCRTRRHCNRTGSAYPHRCNRCRTHRCPCSHPRHRKWSRAGPHRRTRRGNRWVGLRKHRHWTRYHFRCRRHHRRSWCPARPDHSGYPGSRSRSCSARYRYFRPRIYRTGQRLLHRWEHLRNPHRWSSE